MNAIARLLKPRSVAVIGASADPSKTAGRPVSYLVKHGFDGAIYPINPKVEHIGDLPCYPMSPRCPRCRHRHRAARRKGAPCSARPRNPRSHGRHRAASGYTEAGEKGARRQKELMEGQADAPPRAQHDRAGEPHRQHRALGDGRTRDGPLPDRLDRRGLAKRRHSGPCSRAAHSASDCQAYFDQQRGRSRARRFHRLSRRR